MFHIIVQRLLDKLDELFTADHPCDLSLQISNLLFELVDIFRVIGHTTVEHLQVFHRLPSYLLFCVIHVRIPFLDLGSMQK